MHATAHKHTIRHAMVSHATVRAARTRNGIQRTTQRHATPCKVHHATAHSAPSTQRNTTITEQELKVDRMRDNVAQAQNEIYAKLDGGFRFVDEDELTLLKNKMEAVKKLLQQDPGEVNRLTLQKFRCENDLGDTAKKVDVLETNLYKELEEEEHLASAMSELQIQPDGDDDFESRKRAAKELRKLLAENRRAIDDLDANPSAIEKDKEMRRQLGAQGGAIRKYKNDVKTFQQVVKTTEEKQLRAAQQAISHVNANFRDIFKQFFSEEHGWTGNLHIFAREDVEGNWWDRATGLGIQIQMGGAQCLHFDGLSLRQRILAGFVLLLAVNRFDPTPYYLIDDILRHFNSVRSAVPRIIDFLKSMSEKSQVIIASTGGALEDVADAIYEVQHIPAEHRADVQKIL